MLNAIDVILSKPQSKTFQIGDILLAQFTCPPQEEPVGIWMPMDHLLHVVSGEQTWTDNTGTCTAEAGTTVFFRKGAYIMPEHSGNELCLEYFFFPDEFVKEAVIEYAPDLPKSPEPIDARKMTIRVQNDVALSVFFDAMTTYFANEERPPDALLKLKLKELLASILLGQSNPDLATYLRSVASSVGPDLTTVMELNFCQNLPVEAFAQMCHQSASSFKREFRKCYDTSPGKWLLERRLQHSAILLQTTPSSITEIASQCGFEDLSHFSRAFKLKFGKSPRDYRTAGN